MKALKDKIVPDFSRYDTVGRCEAWQGKKRMKGVKKRSKNLWSKKSGQTAL
jgi:hypothetical protein